MIAGHDPRGTSEDDSDNWLPALPARFAHRAHIQEVREASPGGK